MSTDLEDLDLPTGTYNTLQRYGFKTAEDLTKCTWEVLMDLPRFGQRSLYAVVKALSERGLELKPHGTVPVGLQHWEPAPQHQWSCPICGSFRWEHTCTIPVAWERYRKAHVTK